MFKTILDDVAFNTHAAIMQSIINHENYDICYIHAGWYKDLIKWRMHALSEN